MAHEFTLQSFPGVEFRVKENLPPMEIFALSNQIDYNDFEKLKFLTTYVTEHCEVKIGETWCPVKTPKTNAFMPMGIEKNFHCFMEMIDVFLDQVVYPAFPKSEE